MIIKIIPETEKEIEAYALKGIEEVVQNGVKDFLIFGSKIDEDGEWADFHEWRGTPRYLMGPLNYFYQVMNDKRREQDRQPPVKLAKELTKDQPMVKRGSVLSEIQQLDLSKLQENAPDVSIPEEAEVEAEDIKPVGLKMLKD